MNLPPSNVKSRRRYQPQKIYIEKIISDINVRQIESDLIELFLPFGSIIDCKVLRNGFLSRHWRSLRLRDLSGRRNSARSAKIPSCLQRKARELTSYQWSGPWKNWYLENCPWSTKTSPARFLWADCRTRWQGVSSREEIRNFFKIFGRINDVSLPMCKDQLNKGYAFISFENSEAVNRVVLNLDKIVIRAKHVSSPARRSDSNTRGREDSQLTTENKKRYRREAIWAQISAVLRKFWKVTKKSPKRRFTCIRWASLDATSRGLAWSSCETQGLN